MSSSLPSSRHFAVIGRCEVSPKLAPFGEIEELRENIDRLIQVLVELSSGEWRGWRPAVDLLEGDDMVRIELEVPGVSTEQLSLRFRDRKLFIRGRKDRLAEDRCVRRFHLMERFTGGFEIEVAVPVPVDPAGAAAVLEGGVLRVELPRLEEKRHRTYAIDVTERSGREGEDG